MRVGFGLGGVVLPELHPGMRAVAELGQVAQRRAICFHWQHGAGGEIDADADDIRGVDPRFAQHLRHCVLEGAEVILRVLQRPIGLQPQAAIRELLINHPVGIGIHRCAHLPPAGDIDQHCPPALCSKIHTDRIFTHSLSRIAQGLIITFNPSRLSAVSNASFAWSIGNVCVTRDRTSIFPPETRRIARG